MRVMFAKNNRTEFWVDRKFIRNLWALQTVIASHAMNGEKKSMAFIVRYSPLLSRLKLLANLPIIATYSRKWYWIECSEKKSANTQVRFRYVEIPNFWYVQCFGERKNIRQKCTCNLHNQKRSTVSERKNEFFNFEPVWRCAPNQMKNRARKFFDNFGLKTTLEFLFSSCSRKYSFGQTIDWILNTRLNICDSVAATVRDKHPSGSFFFLFCSAHDIDCFAEQRQQST